jgi:hypothetical protein
MPLDPFGSATDSRPFIDSDVSYSEESGVDWAFPIVLSAYFLIGKLLKLARNKTYLIEIYHVSAKHAVPACAQAPPVAVLILVEKIHACGFYSVRLNQMSSSRHPGPLICK